MKRMISALLLTALLLSLGACGGASTAAPENSQSTAVSAAEESTDSKADSTSEADSAAPEDSDVSEEATSVSAIVTVESDLYGEGNTNGGTCIPRESDNDVHYDESTRAVITVSLADGSPVDPEKLDTSNAYIQLDEGDGYYPSDFQFSGTRLDEGMTDGTLTYHLHDGDLQWVNDPDYEVKLGGLEWSCQGGDGNGLYTFNLSVRGITYNGQELDPGYFRAKVYIYGREFSQENTLWGVATINKLKFTEPEKVPLSKVPEVDQEPAWSWSAAAGYDKPVLCDFPQEDYDATDNFYITWPAGVDASGLTADDITITLTGAYTDRFPEDTYILKPNTQMLTLDNGEKMPDGDYSVFADGNVTQIAVNMVYWPYTPVFSAMRISVNCDKVEGYDGTLEKNISIASVYSYRVQTGGGSRTDGTVTSQSVFGVENIFEVPIEDLANIGEDHVYHYKKDDVKAWLVQNADGSFSVTTDETEATVFPDTDPKLLGHTLYSTQYQVKAELNGEEVTFKMEPSCTVRRAEPGKTNLVPLPGFALSQAVGGWGDHMNWPWLSFLDLGWKES